MPTFHTVSSIQTPEEGVQVGGAVLVTGNEQLGTLVAMVPKIFEASKLISLSYLINALPETEDVINWL